MLNQILVIIVAFCAGAVVGLSLQNPEVLDNPKKTVKQHIEKFLNP